MNPSKTHRDKYVAAGDGKYLHFACNLPPFMRCESKSELTFAELTTLQAYNTEATSGDAERAEEALEAWGKS